MGQEKTLLVGVYIAPHPDASGVIQLTVYGPRDEDAEKSARALALGMLAEVSADRAVEIIREVVAHRALLASQRNNN